MPAPAAWRVLEAVGDASGVVAPALPSWALSAPNCVDTEVAALCTDRTAESRRLAPDWAVSIRLPIRCVARLISASPACTLAMPRPRALRSKAVTLAVGSRVTRLLRALAPRVSSEDVLAARRNMFSAGRAACASCPSRCAWLVARATDELACETHWVMEDRVISYLTHARRRTRRLAGFVVETARTAASGAASARWPVAGGLSHHP